MSEAPTLAAFLAGLGSDDAARARVAAERIDALERAIGPPGWIERNLLRLALAALVLFAIGAGGLFGIFGWGRAVFGLGGVTLMVAAFPALMLAYLLSVRGRTRADHEKMVLNEDHFLPHGGLYLGAAEGSGKVVRVDRKLGEKNLREQVQARYDAAIKRKW
ncbi:MAG: hypothetical protein ACTSVG_14875 [Alphaproteobacteria bacterium]